MPWLDLDVVSDLVVNELEATFNRGADVLMPMSPRFIDSPPEGVSQGYVDRLSSKSNPRAHTTESVTSVFDLIDDVEACTEVSNPLNPGQTFAMIDLRDPESATDPRATLDPRWEEAASLPLQRFAAV